MRKISILMIGALASLLLFHNPSFATDPTCDNTKSLTLDQAMQCLKITTEELKKTANELEGAVEKFAYNRLKSWTPAQRNHYLQSLKKDGASKKTIQKYKKMIDTLNKSDSSKK